MQRYSPVRAILFFLATLLMFSQQSVAQIDLQFTQVADIGSVVDIKQPGDGSNRLFLVQLTGNIRILQDNQLLEQPFINLRDEISLGFERGLLSIAFPPDYESTGRFYVYYTDPAGSGVIARLNVSDDPNVALTDIEPILTVFQPFDNHNGGRLAFGPDGMLYFGFGDGGGAGDPQNNAQNPQTLLGKLIRIDVSQEQGFAVPPDNPFINEAGVNDLIWASGLRNPFKISFDRMTGDLFIADVGQDRFEEVNFQSAASGGGQNYGWNIREGANCFMPGCSADGLTDPITEYDHSNGACSITGGDVYRGQNYPALNGLYLYADFCNGVIRGVDAQSPQNATILADTDFDVTAFGEDVFGNIYVADTASGVYLISDGPALPNSVAIQGGHSGTYVVEGLQDEGFFVTVSENEGGAPFVLFAWFTFLNGQPFWLVGNEFYQAGDTEITIQVQQLEGPGFLDFDHPPATRNFIGTATFRMRDCETIDMDYNLGALGSSGEITLDRLTSIAGSTCSNELQ